MTDPGLFPGEARANDLSRPYWEALYQGRFVVQRCTTCEQWQHYPRVRCKSCGARSMRWTQVSGAGTVFAKTVAYRSSKPELEDSCPFSLALVRLDEGPMIMARIAADAGADLGCGDRVALDMAETFASTFLAVKPAL